ncbi:uncharacterized protein [Miscanthus floridulus]|uniref:uncharacterized protein isoform X2 n=1 Tax=Miscanthus floridulus TaxID=154761 RepID=UPI003457E691
MFDKIMDHIDESSAVEDFDNRPSKKIKCSEPEFLDSDRKLNSDPIPSPASPSIQKLSPIIELEDKQACEIDDDQQLQDDKQIKVDTYDYVPQVQPPCYSATSHDTTGYATCSECLCGWTSSNC